MFIVGTYCVTIIFTMSKLLNTVNVEGRLCFCCKPKVVIISTYIYMYNTSTYWDVKAQWNYAGIGMTISTRIIRQL